MHPNRPHLFFWLALGVALSGAALLAAHAFLVPYLPVSIWKETLRPLLIALALASLAAAVAHVYGGSPDAAEPSPPAEGPPRFERRALWTVAVLWLLSVFLPLNP